MWRWVHRRYKSVGRGEQRQLCSSVSNKPANKGKQTRPRNTLFPLGTTVKVTTDPSFPIQETQKPPKLCWLCCSLEINEARRPGQKQKLGFKVGFLLSLWQLVSNLLWTRSQINNLSFGSKANLQIKLQNRFQHGNCYSKLIWQRIDH